MENQLYNTETCKIDLTLLDLALPKKECTLRLYFHYDLTALAWITGSLA